jgi:hypothetical protein
MSETVYFSGQGKVGVSGRTAAGFYTGFKDLGNVPALKLSLETDVIEHNESTSGSRLTDFRLNKQNKARVSMTLENFNRDNLIFLLNGTAVDVAAGTVTTGSPESLAPSGVTIVDGQYLFTSKTKITGALVVKDSAGSPATLTLNTHYTADLSSGRINFGPPYSTTTISTFTQPFTASYTYAINTIVKTFTSGTLERGLFFEGLNTANANKSVRVEIYRVIFDPVQSLDLINDELAQFELEGSALYDSTRASDSNFGGFARIIGDSLL